MRRFRSSDSTQPLVDTLRRVGALLRYSRRYSWPGLRA